MAAVYTFSYSSDFKNQLSETDLVDEIKAEASITPNILRVDRDGDVISICFDSSLSAGEETTLNSIIQNYEHVPKIRYNGTIALRPEDSKFKNTDYSVQDSCIYGGSETMGSIHKISGIGYMESNGLNYSIKIYDKTNNNVIAEKTFTNTTSNIITFDTISNVPTDESILELHLKTGSKKNAFVPYLALYML